MLGLISAFGTAFVLYFSKDRVALDSFDFWVGTVFIFMLATIQSLLYGWALGIERGERELHEGANIRVPHFVQIILKYVTPVYLLAIFVGVCWADGPSMVRTLSKGGVALYSIVFIAGVLAFLMLLAHSAGKRWEREGRLDRLPE
jgi:hypothetical protein